MVQWLEQASQWHEMYCHDLEVMSSSPDRVELDVRASVLSRTWTKKYIQWKKYENGLHGLLASATKKVITKMR